VQDQQLHIIIDASPASDSWGFVGRVMVGNHESYRTLSAYPTPTEAVEAVQIIVGAVLGGMLAGEEWRSLSTQRGHAPTRQELGFGLGAQRQKATVQTPPG
jgi:hypothetical protein